MSTQHEISIPFSLLPEESQQHFRLLELPPDLLDVITADNASPLYLKSPPTAQGTVVICTDNDTYPIRQVSTSNSLFITSPSFPLPDSLSSPGIQAIAQCTTTLELLPPDSSASAVPFIRAAVPVYASTGSKGTGKAVTKRELFDSIPLSEAECETVWRKLACFELEGGVAVVPSESVRLQVWRGILTAARAEGADLTVAVDNEQCEGLVRGEDDWPEELVGAFLRSISDSAYDGEGMVVDGEKLALSLGLALLKDRTANGRNTVAVNDIQAEWADLMPEPWREKASLGRLESTIRRENGGKEITLVDSDSVKAATAVAGAATEAKSTLGAKRKWHEKFRAAKKTA
ncbi:uncharacterized protein LTR77_009330 [Saxophila tyrrhenica]|uniref:Sister chromatid cohesion protein-like protein Dcc1 n=1 Tax=Saxophila tyrrhenica TaxID=1690608 RepID=A0AAV9P258_9PEZI|nr:hypothetical protein LTR77_009330 [Saxophila tyrrhenica]